MSLRGDRERGRIVKGDDSDRRMKQFDFPPFSCLIIFCCGINNIFLLVNHTNQNVHRGGVLRPHLHSHKSFILKTQRISWADRGSNPTEAFVCFSQNRVGWNAASFDAFISQYKECGSV